MKLYFIPILIYKTKKENKDFLYPKPYLSDNAETAIKSVLFGFEILKTKLEDGILIIQAELDKKGRFEILEDERNIKQQIHYYLSAGFSEEFQFSYPYYYQRTKHKFSLIFLNLEM